jgi:urease accessory protein
MHLSKPHLEEDVLVVNVINPTAGLLDGDRIAVSVRVEAGARLLLTAPSATRAHKMKGGSAEITQEYRVASGGFLENWPELFIPQAGARYRQHTELHIEKGGEIVFFETLAPGRVASGEAFAYEALEWETNLFFDEELVARERYCLEPGNESLRALRVRFPTAYYASCFVVSPSLSDDSPVWRSLHDLYEENAWIGCSRFVKGGWAIKAVVAESILFRQKLAMVRRLIYQALQRAEPCIRRASPIA